MTPQQKRRVLKFRRYHNLMPHRVREVLLVSSLYDAFILQEDGHLTEQIFLEYKSLALSSAPRFTHVTGSQAALDAMESRRFDVVLVMPRIQNLDLIDFGRQVKEKRPGRPVVVLAFDNHELDELRVLNESPYIDAVFSWNGDATILLAIIKYIEDRENIDHDIAVADVRVILLVEDSIRFYSEYFARLYPELMRQSQRLFSEGLNRLQKLLRMRTRPKILHTTTYEGAVELFEKYRDNLVAVIADAGFYRHGRHDKRCGLDLVREFRKHVPSLPILFQTANEEMRGEVGELGVRFLNKTSPQLLNDLQTFLEENVGFGDFVFRMPSGEEIARATDIRALEQCLVTIPAASLEYHAGQNHISNWLMARSEFELAAKIGSKKVSDFKSVEDVRRYLLTELRRLRKGTREGIISDFSVENFDPDSLFQRIGAGSLGGKARGLAFMNLLLTSHQYRGMVGGMPAQIPQTFVLSTENFDRFIEENDLHHFAFAPTEDEEVNRRFLRARLPHQVVEALEKIIEFLDCPLAVRSSSLLEDDMSHPFAGIYRTIMLANNALFTQTRLDHLCDAVKLVYASTFHNNAKAYIENTSHRVEQEKMAVVIQRVVGQRYEKRFYPHFAGVAQSYNYYPVGPQNAEDGVVQMALGLGRMVVEGGHIYRFSPHYPKLAPQYPSPAMMLKNSQNRFYSLDLTLGEEETQHFEDALGDIQAYDLTAAEQDGTLQMVGSRYDADNDRLTEGPEAVGPWVVTFSNILKYSSVPLPDALCDILDLMADGMGCAVEVEFACDMGDYGRRLERGRKRRAPPTMYALQLRPIVTLSELTMVENGTFTDQEIICRSIQALGHGSYENLFDVVYVKQERFKAAESTQIAKEVGDINRKLHAEGRPYILIGPGRWGSSDHWLGIPVAWSQISGAQIIIEASPKDFHVDPSQGSHFFHNITSLGLGYFTVPPGATAPQDDDAAFLDWAWLDSRPACEETQYLRHVRLDRSLTAMIDGRKGLGVIACCQGGCV
ncbi:MAG: PEP/pyruvate-binding domain-containing protein [Candidatus Lernaella stagnicola]|nr:PEP/pyruvate-binding domain-containing protein [Candidatus Lernaella stagnicola]